MKFILVLFLLSLAANTYSMSSRLKDIVTIKGVRSNPIIGYGLVIGLNGTGDGGGEITSTAMKRMYKKLGLNPKKELASKNVASVIVTAKLPPFAKIGQKIDVTISSIGDAKSLAGGTLLITPLKAGDDKIYAISSGNISIGGLKNGSKFPTKGIISNGATVEKELPINFYRKKSLRLTLNNPDFTTAARIEKTINKELGGKFAIAKDSSTIDLMIPDFYQRKIVQLVAIVENFKVVQDRSAKIVINERTGTVVAGGDILLSNAAISHNDLSIEISSDDDNKKNEEAAKGSIYYIEKKTKLSDLVKALNAFGTTPEDLISIFQALKSNGALIGEIELI